jgi:hypothetical protein
MSSRSPVRIFFALAAACASIGLAGCVHNTTLSPVPMAAPPQPATERPMNVAPDTDASPPHHPAPAPPQIAENLSPPQIADDMPIMKMPSAPPKPATERFAEHEPEPVDHAPPPQIVPQISPSEQQNYERQASSDASAAQQVLSQAAKRQLNPQQRDLRDKIRSFLKQSQDAGKTGDWAAAQNFAQKAHLLSVELLNLL